MAFRDFFIQVGALLKSLTPGKKIALSTLVGATIVSLAVLIIWTGRPNFELLYSGLSPEDAGAILVSLKEQKIPYSISSNGTAIMIPREKVYETRLELASQGLPQGSGVGFEIFDNTKLGVTEFVQNINYQRALQGELSRTINGLTEVESSRVHLVMPSKSLFIEDEEPATASVVLKMRPGQRLGKEQVQGIVHLVSSSVSGLDPKNVTIVDNKGKMLSELKKDSEIEPVSTDQLEFQRKVDGTFQDRIKTMLDAALGPGKAIVRVSCTLDFRRQEKREETYQPDNKVTRSEQLLNEASSGGDKTPMGIPGVVSNVTGQTGTKGTTTGQGQSFQKQDRTVNYEIGKVTSHTVEPVGTIRRMSVAVIVDGTYEFTEGEDGKKEWNYRPRTKEEMEKLENIVKRAASFDAERGDEIEVVNIPFESTGLKAAEGEEEPVGEEQTWTTNLRTYVPFMRYGFLGLFLFLSFLFVTRPLIKWLTAVGEMDISKQLPMTVGEAERQFGAGEGLPYRQRASHMIAKDKEPSVQLMKDWLKEG
jgi:flagellar M-ring protein FliF